jgi:hypothetical protein
MKALRVCSYLLLCASYTIVVGCNKAVMTQRIQITGCVATPEGPTVHDMDPVSWATDVNYLITFIPTNTPNGQAVPVSPNPFTVVAGSTVPHVIHGPINCSTAGCYYKYTLTKFNNGVPESVPCIDPGIRVIR